MGWASGRGRNAEICLLATKGHPKRQAADIHQFIISPIEAHSKKPDEARDKIVALMGDLAPRGAVRTADPSRLGRVGQRGGADIRAFGHGVQKLAERRMLSCPM